MADDQDYAEGKQMEGRELRSAEAILLGMTFFLLLVFRNNFTEGFALGILLMFVNYWSIKGIMGRKAFIRGAIFILKTGFSLLFIYLIIKWKREIILPFAIGTGMFPVLLAINVLILYFMNPDGRERA